MFRWMPESNSLVAYRKSPAHCPGQLRALGRIDSLNVHKKNPQQRVIYIWESLMFKLYLIQCWIRSFFPLENSRTVLYAGSTVEFQINYFSHLCSVSSQILIFSNKNNLKIVSCKRFQSKLVVTCIKLIFL